MKGISTHSQLMKGGIFKTAGFDPFRRMGVASSFNAGTRYGNATVTKTPKYFAGFNDAGTASFYIWADNGTSPALYKTSLAGSVSDYSSNVVVTNSLARGLIVWKNKLVYARDTEIRCIDLTGTPNDTQLLSGLTSGDHPFTIGADLNLYCPNGNSIARLTSTAGTTGNTISCFDFETGMNLRHLINDGRYMVILGDTNSLTSGTSNNTNFGCLVAFWDLTSPTLAQRYDFFSSGLIGGGQLDDGTYIIGRDNFYVCNVATRPSVVTPFTGSANITIKPSGVGAIAVRGNQLIWGNATFIGYGNLTTGDKKIFFVPASNSGGNITAIGTQTNAIWAGSDTPDLYDYDNGGSTISSSIVLSQIVFERPYQFDYAKIVTYQALSTGQTFSFSMNTLNATYQVTQSDDKAFSSDGVRTSLIFKRKNTAGNAFAQTFEELDNITIALNAPIVKFEIWGTPVDNQDSKLLT